MKNIYALLATTLAAATSFAQPAITGGNVPPIGYTKSLSTGPAAAPPSATGGANVTWDFSGISLPTVGTMTVIDPAGKPFVAQFPGTNFAFKFDMGGQTLYYYYASSAAKLDLLASDVTSTAAGGNTYTNGRSTLDFPINYLGTTTDTYQKTSGSPQTTTNTYDGYGTLKTPYGTYNNVVRIKQVNSAFPNPDYMWFQTSPLLNIFAYISNNNSYFSFDGGTTGVNGPNAGAATVVIAPNPVRSKATVSINTTNSGSIFAVYNTVGSLVQRNIITSGTIEIDAATWARGLYFYRLENAEGADTRGKFIVE